MATLRSRSSTYPDLSGRLDSAELLKRLKSCAHLLTSIDQGKDDHSPKTPELEKVASALVRPEILSHMDRGVRLVAACCLSDILRIFAPDAPYSSGELKDVQSLFVEELRLLKDPGSRDYQRAYYLLENISIVKSFLLCVSLEDAEDILVGVFRVFFEIISEKHSYKVQAFMLDIMMSILLEQSSMPQQMLELILMQLPSELQESPVSGQLAKNLLEKCTSTLEPFITMYFNQALTVGRSAESALGEFNLYELIFELDQAAPATLLSVLPQLEHKLKSQDPVERQEATHLLARMFAAPEKELAEMNAPLWRCWLSRFHDINPRIRTCCVQFSKYFLVYHPLLAGETADQLVNTAADPDESVRFEVLETIQSAFVQQSKCITSKLLTVLQERILDKKFAVREKAMIASSKVFCKVQQSLKNQEDDTEKSDQDVFDMLSWVPDRVLQCYYHQSSEDLLAVERCVFVDLVPVLANDNERISRLIDIYSSLNSVNARAFNEMLKKREDIRQHLQSMLDAYESEDRMRLHNRAFDLARVLPDGIKAQEQLKQLLPLLKNRELFMELLKCLDVDKGCAHVREAVRQVQKLAGENPVWATLEALLDRAAPLLIDSHCVSLLLRTTAEEVDFGIDGDDEDAVLDDGLASARGLPRKTLRCLQLVMALANQYPSLFQQQEVYEYLMSFMKNSHPFVVEAALCILKDIGGQMEKTHPSIASCLVPLLVQLAQRGTPRQAKLVLRGLPHMLKDHASIMDQIFQAYLKALNYDNKDLVTTLTGLGHLALLLPRASFEDHEKTIIRTFIIKQLLMKDREGKGYREKDAEWVADNKISRETCVKMAGLKTLSRWLQSLKDFDNVSALPVLRLLHVVLKNDGDLKAEGKVCAWERSRLRLTAACCLLRVAKAALLSLQIDGDMFMDLALVIQDPCVEVRKQFGEKLYKGLRTFRLPVAYLSILALANPDPVKEQKALIKQYLQRVITQRRQLFKQKLNLSTKVEVIMPEYAVPFLIFILAHHPDYLENNSKETLQQLKDYLWFFLEPPLVRPDNYGFLKKSVELIKQARDAHSPDDEEAQKRLYAVCDLALGLMANKVTHFTSEPFPGRVVLPTRLFVRPSDETQLNMKRYLPADFSFSPGKKKGDVALVKTPAQVAVKTKTSADVSPPSSTSTTARQQQKAAAGSSKASTVAPHQRPSRQAKTAAHGKLTADSSEEESLDNEGETSDDTMDSIPAASPRKKSPQKSRTPSPKKAPATSVAQQQKRQADADEEDKTNSLFGSPAKRCRGEAGTTSGRSQPAKRSLTSVLDQAAGQDTKEKSIAAMESSSKGRGRKRQATAVNGDKEETVVCVGKQTRAGQTAKQTAALARDVDEETLQEDAGDDLEFDSADSVLPPAISPRQSEGVFPPSKKSAPTPKQPQQPAVKLNVKRSSRRRR